MEGRTFAIRLFHGFLFWGKRHKKNNFLECLSVINGERFIYLDRGERNELDTHSPASGACFSVAFSPRSLSLPYARIADLIKPSFCYLIFSFFHREKRSREKAFRHHLLSIGREHDFNSSEHRSRVSNYKTHKFSLINSSSSERKKSRRRRRMFEC